MPQHLRAAPRDHHGLPDHLRSPHPAPLHRGARENLTPHASPSHPLPIARSGADVFDGRLRRYAQPHSNLLLAAAYALLFVGGALAIRWLQTIPAEEYLLRKGLHAATCALMIPYAATGTFTAWLLVNRLLQGRAPGRIFVAAGTLCFAVYIFHQFLLKALYYRTPLPARVDPHALPFIGLAVALTGSVALAIAARRTRIGRYLLG